MTRRYENELSALQDKVVAMGDLVQDMVRDVIAALTSGDRSRIARLEEKEEQVDRFQVGIDDDVLRLVTVYGPVALDLRFVLMTARINTDLERVGDEAVNIAERMDELLRASGADRAGELPRMATKALRMLEASLEAYRSRALDQARRVIRADGEVDALDDQIVRELLDRMMNDPRAITSSMVVIFAAQAIERIADHATNIAEEVIYMVQGTDVRHSRTRAAPGEAG